MVTLARSMLRDAAAADDVVTEALLRVHHKGHGFRGERGLRTWVLRIVANLCRDQLRRRRFEAGTPEDLSPLAHAGLHFDPGPAWDDALDAERQAEALERALAALPTEQREAMVMRHRLGLSHEEMVELLGVPLGTVKSRLARGLATLRAALEGTR
jgi:RNA polymerase sigma-70 factor (ECF subfamily)